MVNRIEIKPTTTAERISDDITHALHRSYFFDPKTIAVTAVDGRVELTGTVKSWNDWEVAAATAWGAPGVRAVDNRITIILSGNGSHMGYRSLLVHLQLGSPSTGLLNIVQSDQPLGSGSPISAVRHFRIAKNVP